VRRLRLVAPVVAVVAVLLAAAPAGASDPVASYIRTTHEVLLAEPAPEDVVASWRPAVERGDRAAMTLALVASRRWAEVRVLGLYDEVLGRAPEAEGLHHWSGMILAGVEPREVAAHLLSSWEHRYRHRALDDGAYVDLLYRIVLGRNADPDGRAHWLAQLEAGASAAALAGRLGSSPEALGRHVDLRYRALLLRGAGPAERAWWVGYLVERGERSLDAALAASDERYASVIVYPDDAGS